MVDISCSNTQQWNPNSTSSPYFGVGVGVGVGGDRGHLNHKRKQQQQNEETRPVIISQEDEDSYGEMMSDNDDDRRCSKRIRLSPPLSFSSAPQPPSFFVPLSSSYTNTMGSNTASTTMAPFTSNPFPPSSSLWISPHAKHDDVSTQSSSTFGQTREEHYESSPEPMTEWWKKKQSNNTPPPSISSTTTTLSTSNTNAGSKQTCFICLSTSSSPPSCTIAAPVRKEPQNSLLSYFTHTTRRSTTHSTPTPKTSSSIGTSCSTIGFTNFTKCTHCDRFACDSCAQACVSCQMQFCTFCSTVNYDEEVERIFCLDCVPQQHQRGHECDMEM
mmetsp:Transcript_28399/g.42459  ORF Transcript_28399/g.42459 Transcript_28399/m.42459 type:complete len:329 (+) Transcript_28399:177-1163(+)